MKKGLRKAKRIAEKKELSFGYFSFFEKKSNEKAKPKRWIINT